MSIGTNLILSLIRENKFGKLLEVDANSLNAEFELPAYEFALNYYHDHEKLPPVNLVAQRFKLDIPEGESQFWEKEFSKLRFSLIYETGINKVNQLVVKGDTEKVHSELTRLISDLITAGGADKGTVKRSEGLKLVQDMVSVRRTSAGIVGIPTGYPTLDRLINGFLPANIYVLAARMKMGKTMLMAIMAEVAFRLGYKVLFISMEMNREEFFTRVMSLVARISSHALFRGEVSNIADAYLRDLVEDAKTRDDDYIFQEGFLSTSLQEISFKIAIEKPQIVFIDGAYLVKLPGASNKIPLWEKATEIIGNLKVIAGKHNVPLVCSYQFNREAAKKTTAGTENLHHSDAIGQIATVVMGMFEIPNRPDQRKIEVIANRNGPCGYSIIDWDWNRVQFNEADGFEEGLGILLDGDINSNDETERRNYEETTRVTEGTDNGLQTPVRE